MNRSTISAGFFHGGLPYNRFGWGPRIAVIFQGLWFENKPLTGFIARGQIGIYRFLNADYTSFLVTRRPDLPPGFSVRDMADDYAAMIRQEFDGPVDVIGVSLGGAVALQFAVDHPHLIRRLVIHSSAYTATELSQQAEQALARLAREGRWREAWAVFLRLTHIPPGHWYTSLAVEVISRALARVYAPRKLSDFVVSVEADVRFNIRDHLDEVQAPTLVVGGDRDPFYSPDLFRETAAGIRNAEFILYPGMGHPVSGKQFARDVLAFLRADTARSIGSGTERSDQAMPARPPLAASVGCES